MHCLSTAKCTGQTGVEMEAITACSVALLKIYDMCKAVDRGMTVSGLRLMEKRGSGVRTPARVEPVEDPLKRAQNEYSTEHGNILRAEITEQ